MSEEKTLPASDRKLSKAREKGQIAHSRDLVPTITLGVLMIYLYFTGGALVADLVEGYEALTNVQGRPLDKQFLSEVMQRVASLTAAISLPPLVIGTVVAITVAIIDSRGIVFSLEPLKPDLGRLDPIKGLGRMFGPQGLTYLLLNFARALIVMILTVLVIFFFLPTMQNAAHCSVVCGLEATLQISWLLAFLCLGVLILSLIFELPLSRLFFQNEMKMTYTEQKQEIREMLGDTQIRQARREIRDEALNSRVGPRHTNLVLSGPEFCVGVYYRKGETAAPLLTFKGYGPRGEDLRHEATLNGAIEVEDTQLARQLFTTARIGQFVPRTAFDKVALHLIEAGII